MKVLNSRTVAHLFLLLDHAERPGNPRRWYQREGARHSCASDSFCPGLIEDVEHSVALEIRNEMEFVFVRTVREALEAAFGKGVLG